MSVILTAVNKYFSTYQHVYSSCVREKIQRECELQD